MNHIDELIDLDSNIILNAPTKTPVGRINETKANRELDLNYYNNKE